MSVPEENVAYAPPIDATPKKFTATGELLKDLNAKEAEFAAQCEALKEFGRKYLRGRARVRTP